MRLPPVTTDDDTGPDWSQLPDRYTDHVTPARLTSDGDYEVTLDPSVEVAELRARADAAEARLDQVATLAEQASVTAQEVAQAARRR